MKARLARLERENSMLAKSLAKTRQINMKLMKEVNALRAEVYGNPIDKFKSNQAIKVMTKDLLSRAW